MATPQRTALVDRIRSAARQPRPEDFGSPLHDERVVARVGVWLGACLAICFLTGLISHYQQHRVDWLPIGPDPAWGYRVTQGAHVISGTLMLPLLLAKLFSAYPRLFTWPPVRGLVHALDRLSVALLISCTAFQIATGLMNTAQWYPWHFGFVATHFVIAWAAFGSLLIHISVKLPVIQRALSRPLADADDEHGTGQHGTAQHGTAQQSAAVEPPLTFGADPDGRTRRGFLIAVGAATAGIGLLSAGETITPLRHFALLAPRRPDVGPQGLPINRTAAAARVTQSAADPNWQLQLAGPKGDRRFSRADLEALPGHVEDLPIACVEGWSAQATWQGVRIRDLVALIGGTADSRVLVESLEKDGNYRMTELPAAFADDPRTLLALRVNGQVLHPDHGYPARIIAPDRPGVLQTKWISRLTVSGGAR